MKFFGSFLSPPSLPLFRKQKQSPPPPNKKKKKLRPLSERFLGLSAALVTTDAVAAAAAATGEDSFGGLLDKVETFPVSAPLMTEPLPSSAAASLLASRVSLLLGIDKPMQVVNNGAKENESDDGSFDLVFVHLTAEAFSSSGAAAAADEIDASQSSALSFADSFLKQVRSSPGAVDDRGDDALLLLVVFSSSNGSGSGEEEEKEGGRLALLPLPPRGGAPLPLPQFESSTVSVPRPAQSFEFAEGVQLETKGEALLVASRCDGVLRVDGARRLLECCSGRTKSAEGEKRSETSEKSKKSDNDDGGGGVVVFPGGTGLGCLLAEHLLDEVAYKIGRALKYGA